MVHTTNMTNSPPASNPHSPPPSDDSLPEVVPFTTPPLPFESIPSSSPQVTLHEKDFHWQTCKYPIIYDRTPKFASSDLPPDDDKIPFDSPQAWSPSTTTPSTLKSGTWDSLPAGSNPYCDENQPPSPPLPARRICRLPRRTFFILLGVLTLVVITATITLSITLTRASSPSQPSILTLNNSTAAALPHPGFAFQSFSGTNFTGAASRIIQDEGFHDIEEARSYVWLPSTTNCCVTFCQDEKTATGWWCNARYRTEASGVFGRVSIWCGGWRAERRQNETCS